MGVKLIELRPDRALLKSNFDGYKLSLDPVPVFREEHQNLQLPNRDYPNVETQYSFLHQELFGHQNLLFSDPWTANSVYYVTGRNDILNIRFDGKISRKRVLHASSGPRSPGDYNFSLQFVSEDHVVVSNGQGTVYLISTGNRSSSTSPWKVVHEEVILENEGFVIKDAQLELNGDRKVINLLLHQIIPETDCNEKFVAKLIWIRFKENGDANWERISRKELIAKKTIVPFCAFVRGGNGFVVATQKSFKFISDSDKEVISPAEKEKNNSVNVAFSWTQSDEDVVIHFGAQEEANKSDFYVKCTRDSIQIKFRETILIDSQLSFKIDPDLTTWNLQNDALQVTMVKATEGETWQDLIPNGPAEVKESDSVVVAESFISVPDLTSALEDCDRDDGEFFIEQVDALTHSISHRIFLGSNGPLFAQTLPDGKAIALRHDVDTCLWSLEGNSDNWRHRGTLDAFGYVAASKQQRKFLQCSPDMNYSVICEPERHVFIYRGEYASAGGLRNRGGSGNQIKFGQQSVVALEETGEVVGMSVQNDVTFLLTQKCVLCLKINE